ncbi:MAG: hypothetical protein AVDCRST_MAG87-4005, partial [uncultured Thermomicrobiales bacterium]
DRRVGRANARPDADADYVRRRVRLRERGVPVANRDPRHLFRRDAPRRSCLHTPEL